MTEEGLRYDVMVESALRGVVRAALEVAADQGLPGEHHFYITFRTGHPGVEMADYLRERYPNEMTIVVQYQFWDLKVLDERFEVTLSFNDKPEPLVVPYAAVSAFADPSVRFGLQFDADVEDEDSDDLSPPEEANKATTASAAEDVTVPGAAAQETAEIDQEAESEEEPEEESGAKVITLDSFRKK